MIQCRKMLAAVSFIAAMAIAGFTDANSETPKGTEEQAAPKGAGRDRAENPKAQKDAEARYRLRTGVQDLKRVGKKPLKAAKEIKRRLVDLGLEDIYFDTTAGPRESIWDWNRQTEFGTFLGPTNGVTFMKVRPGSAFAKAGLKSKDLIVTVDQQITWPFYLLNPRTGGSMLLNNEVHLLTMFGPLVKDRSKSTWKILRPTGWSKDGRRSFKDLTLTVTLP